MTMSPTEVKTIIPAPAGYVVDYNSPQTQYIAQSYTVVAVEMTLAFIFLLQRLYTKIVIMKKFQLEDGKPFLDCIQILSLIMARSCCYRGVGSLYGHADMSAPWYCSWSCWTARLGDQY